MGVSAKVGTHIFSFFSVSVYWHLPGSRPLYKFLNKILQHIQDKVYQLFWMTSLTKINTVTYLIQAQSSLKYFDTIIHINKVYTLFNITLYLRIINILCQLGIYCFRYDVLHWYRQHIIMSDLLLFFKKSEFTFLSFTHANVAWRMLKKLFISIK